MRVTKAELEKRLEADKRAYTELLFEYRVLEDKLRWLETHSKCGVDSCITIALEHVSDATAHVLGDLKALTTGRR